MPRLREELKDTNAEQLLFFRRTVCALVGILFLLSVLLINIYRLQVIAFEDYQTRSNGNRIRILPIAPTRGLVYDRNFVLLAENRPIYNLALIPEQVPELEKTVDALSDLLDLDAQNKEEFLKEVKLHRRFKPVLLAERLNEDQVTIFSVHQHHFPEVTIQASLRRYYPFGGTLTHSLGYVAKINTMDARKA